MKKVRIPGIHVVYLKTEIITWTKQKIIVLERKWFADLRALNDIGPLPGYLDSYDLRVIKGVLILLYDNRITLFYFKPLNIHQ